jgi:hypothetical protein
LKIGDTLARRRVKAPRPALSGRQIEALSEVKNRKHPAMGRVMEAFS